MAACRNKKSWGLDRASLCGTKSRPPAAARRGVILLVLLGILALFGATAFAFLVIASHGNRAAKSLQKVDRVALSPQRDLEEAMYQVLRGSNNNTSVLRSHSLLDDIYGGSWLGGWVVNRFSLAPTDAGGWVNPKGLPAHLLPGTATDPPNEYVSVLGGGQIIEFTAGYTVPQKAPCGGLDLSTGEPTTGSSVAAGETFTIPEWFGVANEPFEFERRVGCVLTITDHPISRRFKLDNKSTRIIGYRRVEMRNPSNELQIAYHRYQILPFEGVSVADTLNYLANTGQDLAEIPKDDAKAGLCNQRHAVLGRRGRFQSRHGRQRRRLYGYVTREPALRSSAEPDRSRSTTKGPDGSRRTRITTPPTSRTCSWRCKPPTAGPSARRCTGRSWSSTGISGFSMSLPARSQTPRPGGG
jgi:hypothetical protein